VTAFNRRGLERADEAFDFDEDIDRRTSNSVKWACSGKLLTPEECVAERPPEAQLVCVADRPLRLAARPADA